MKINLNDLVLEVGSGDKPYPYADVLLDKLPGGSDERDGGKKLVMDRLVVIGDAEALPFADKSFDYIIASHVLEHAQDPAKFLDELSRVGKRGYIETPLPLRERVFDWPFHRWYIDQDDKKLILIKKTAKSKIFFAGMSQEKIKGRCYLNVKSLSNLQFEWSGGIQYKVFVEESDKFLRCLDEKLMQIQKLGLENRTFGKSEKFSKWLKDNLFRVKIKIENIYIRWERRKKIDLLSLLVCPACRNKLKLKGGKLICVGCGRSYGFIKDKIPQFYNCTSTTQAEGEV